MRAMTHLQRAIGTVRLNQGAGPAEAECCVRSGAVPETHGRGRDHAPEIGQAPTRGRHCRCGRNEQPLPVVSSVEAD